MFSRLDAKRMEFKKNVHDENLIVLDLFLSIGVLTNHTKIDFKEKCPWFLISIWFLINICVLTNHTKIDFKYMNARVKKNTTTVYFLDKARKKFKNSP